MRKEVRGPGGRHRTKEHRAAAPQPEGRGAPPSEELQGSGLFVVKPALRRRKGAAEFPWKMLRLLERLLTQKQRLWIAREEVLEENSSGRTSPDAVEKELMTGPGILGGRRLRIGNSKPGEVNRAVNSSPAGKKLLPLGCDICRRSCSFDIRSKL